MPTTNTDPQNGIHYSTIYGHTISSNVMTDIIFLKSRNMTYESALDEFQHHIRDNITGLLEDESINPDIPAIISILSNLIDIVADQFNDSYDDYGEADFLYDFDEYTIEYHAYDDSLIILKSPYVTHCRLASPCFPNGCYLPAYDPDCGHKCYCLDNTFFDEFNPIPYNYHKLQDGE